MSFPLDLGRNPKAHSYTVPCSGGTLARDSAGPARKTKTKARRGKEWTAGSSGIAAPPLLSNTGGVCLPRQTTHRRSV